MNRSNEILQYLTDIGVHYTVFEHEPKLTIESCQTIEGVDWSRSAMCKNVFLSNRQETAFYLILLRHDLPFKTSVISKLLGVSRLSFAKQELLSGLLFLDPGAVNPFSLIFDTDRHIRLGVDEDLRRHEFLLFHPGVNTMSLRVKSDDFFDVFLPACGHKPDFLHISAD